MKKKIIGIFALGLTALTVTACGTSTGGTNETASTTTSNSTTASTTTSNATNTSTTEQTTTYSESSNTDMVNEIDRTFKDAIFGSNPLILYEGKFAEGKFAVNGEPNIYLFENGALTILRARDENLTFGDLSQMTDEEIVNRVKQSSNKIVGDKVRIYIITDESGNNVVDEGFFYYTSTNGKPNMDRVHLVGVCTGYSGGQAEGDFDSGFILNSEYRSLNHATFSDDDLGVYHRLSSENGLFVNLIPDSTRDSDVMIEYGGEYSNYGSNSEYKDAYERLENKIKEEYGME